MTTFVFLAVIVGLVTYLSITDGDLEVAHEGEGSSPVGYEVSAGSGS